MSGTLGGLPRIQAQERIRPVGPPGMVNLGDGGAGALTSLSRSASALGAEFQQQADTLATERGRQDGAVIERDAEGRPVAPTMSSGLTPYDRARDASARVAYLDTAKQDALTEFTRMAGQEQYRTAPEAFLAAARESARARAAAAPDWARGELSRELEGLAQGMGRRAISEWSNVQLRQQANAWQMQIQTYGEEMRLLAFEGRAADDPAMVAARARYVAQVERGVAAGHINAEQRVLMVEEAATNAVAMGIAGQAQRIAETQGPEAARRFLDGALADPRLAAAGDRVISQARAMGDRAIHNVRIERSIGQGEVREQIGGLAANQRAGVQVDAATWETAARRADAAGLPQVAREARALARIGGEVAALAGAGLPEISAAYQRAVRGDPSDPVNGLRAQQFGRMLEQQVQVLQRDPVGWAQAQPTVRAAMDRLGRGEGTVAEVVRAQDAALAAQGVPVANARVLSRQRVDQIAETVRQAPPGEQARVLEQAFLAYPPEYRFRIWNDLTSEGGGANVPAGLRPAMILMTSERSRAALPMFLTAAGMTETQRTDAAGGTDGMRDLNEAVRRKMDDFRATGSPRGETARYMADVQEAVRMVALSDASGSPRDRVDRAWRMVVDSHVTVARAGGSDIRVPAGVQVNVPKLDETLRSLMRDRVDTMRFAIPEGAVPPRAGLTEEARQAAYLRSVARGDWVTLPDGTGVIRVDGERRPVALSTGQLLIVRYGEETTGEIASLRAPPVPPSVPAPAAPTPGPQSGSVRDLNQQFAARRQQIMDDPTLNARQREQRLADLSAERARAGGTPEARGGYRDAPWAAGLPPPTGTVAR